MSEEERDKSDPDAYWLGIASDSFDASTSYLDDNYRKPIERNIALFQSKHPAGSKYNSEAYKRRSRLFRPKTKSFVRKLEASGAAAFFANVDVVSIEPENDGDPQQVASAELMGELVNYRLTKSIPWFQILIGGLQEAAVNGVVISYQYWEYEEEIEKAYEQLTDDMGQPLMDASGQPYYTETEQVKVKKDKPCVELVPFENFRFDPGACWTNIVESSPYLIRLVPMYVGDVLERMETEDPKTGQPKWKKYTEAEIRQAIVEYDTTRQQRAGQKEDPLANNNAPLKEFEIVWCHENFVRIDGEEMVFWTLGTQKLLSKPVKLKEAYFHGQRPFAIGTTAIEAHKAVPDSLVAMGSEIQRELNDTVNQRRDNVALVLNKRYIVKRNAQVDIDSLLKNVAGAVTMANSVDDVKEMNWPDVTSSAYQEQNLLNVDFDEIVGSFSQGSVSSNRNLNETVGGMQLMGEAANQMTEYEIRTLVETWVEPLLSQLVKLEQAYETDMVVLGLMGEKAQLAQKYGIDAGLDQLLDAQLTIRVNVGMGATNPQQKLGRFMFALKTYAEVMQMMPDADPEAIRKEVFGLIGYKDGSRFFKKTDDPKTAQLEAQMQEMQQMLQQLMQENQAIKMDKTAQLITAQSKARRDEIDATVNANLSMAKMDLTEAQTGESLTKAQMMPSQMMMRNATEPARA